MFNLLYNRINANIGENKRDVANVISIFVFILICIVWNIGFLFIYKQSNTIEMVYYNFFAVFLNIIILLCLLSKRQVLHAYIIFVVSVCIYIVYTTYFLGYNKSAYVLFLPLIFAMQVISPINKKNFWIVVSIISFSYLWVIYIRYNVYSKYVFSHESIEIINLMIAICSSIFIIFTKNIGARFFENYTDARIRSLESKSNTDYLTGLLNRRYLEEIFYSETDFEQTYIIMADIDFFKKVNDTYGHIAGDFVLKEVSSMIAKYFDEDDYVARWGGEEFLIYAKDREKFEVKDILNNLRQQVFDRTFNYYEHEIRTSLTFGVKSIDPNESIEKNIYDADKALYYGKRNGRNQVVFNEDMK